MNYCFNARAGLNKYCPKIYKQLKSELDKDANAIFVVLTNKEAAGVLEIVPDAVIYNMTEYFEEHHNEFTYEKFLEYEAKYECAPLWKYIYTDRFLINRDYNYVVQTTVGLFMFYEHLFTKYSIDVYYSETIATLQCYVAYIVGKKKDAHYYAHMGARGLFATHSFVLDDPFQNIINLDPQYKDKEYSESEIKRASAFLKEFEDKDQIPIYMQTTGKRPSFKLSFLWEPVNRLLKSFDRNYNNPYNYIDYKSYRKFTDPLFFYCKYQICKKYYRKPDYSQKYVYFPLHFQPEASTIVCAQKYEKQLYFIDSWAKSLPADTVLYVKEHYAVLGHRAISFYKDLKKYPNVVLIDPWESSRKMMKNAVAVTTLTGTAGWEAMMMRKPVFIGGNVFFDKAPGVIKAEDIFQNYLNNMQNWKQPSREVLINYLCGYFRSIREGVQYGIPNAESDNNIRKVAQSLIDTIHEAK